jgi:hypothetical protein
VNGAPAGALCQSFAPVGGTPGGCWNLLGASEPGLVRKTGQSAGVVLIRQGSPANASCPQNTAATDVAGHVVAASGPIATGLYCLDFGQVFPPPGQGGNVVGNVAMAITDGLSSTTVTASLMRRN